MGVEAQKAQEERSSQRRSNSLGAVHSGPLFPCCKALRQQPCDSFILRLLWVPSDRAPTRGRCRPPQNETVRDPAFKTKQLLSIKGIKLTRVIWVIQAFRPVHGDESPREAVPGELGSVSQRLHVVLADRDGFSWSAWSPATYCRTRVSLP